MKLNTIISTLFIIINLQCNMLNASSYENITINAQDYPTLVEGFALCGRYNLQEFFNEKIKAFQALDNRENTIHTDQDNQINKEMKIFDALSHAIIPAQDLIVEKISKNPVLHSKFCAILLYAIDHDIDLNSQAVSFFGPKLHLDQFFQYCIRTDFMAPTVQHWILSRTEMDNSSYSFVERAIELNSSKILQFLINKKFDIRTLNERRYYINEYTSMENEKKYYSNNPLCLAILYNANNVIPVFIAAKMHQSQTNNPILMKKMVKGDKRRYHPAKSYENNIPLHIAIDEKKHIALKALLDAGIDINFKDSKGNTPLHLAAETSNHKAILILLNNGADLHATNNEKKSPWDIATNEETQNLLKLPDIHDHTCHCAIS